MYFLSEILEICGIWWPFCCNSCTAFGFEKNVFLTWGEIRMQVFLPSGFWNFGKLFSTVCWYDGWDHWPKRSSPGDVHKCPGAGPNIQKMPENVKICKIQISIKIGAKESEKSQNSMVTFTAFGFLFPMSYNRFKKFDVDKNCKFKKKIIDFTEKKIQIFFYLFTFAVAAHRFYNEL